MGHFPWLLHYEMELWIQNLFVLSLIITIITGVFVLGYSFGVSETIRAQKKHIQFLMETRSTVYRPALRLTGRYPV